MCQNFIRSVFEILTKIKNAKCDSKKTYTVLVEGNIGCGKSTFLKLFNKYSDHIELLQEPLDKWQNVNGCNLLHMMYDDPQRYETLKYLNTA